MTIASATTNDRCFVLKTDEVMNAIHCPPAATHPGRLGTQNTEDQPHTDDPSTAFLWKCPWRMVDGYSAKFRMGGWTLMEVKRCSDSWIDQKSGWMDIGQALGGRGWIWTKMCQNFLKILIKNDVKIVRNHAILLKNSI